MSKISRPEPWTSEDVARLIEVIENGDTIGPPAALNRSVLAEHPS